MKIELILGEASKITRKKSIVAIRNCDKHCDNHSNNHQKRKIYISEMESKILESILEKQGDYCNIFYIQEVVTTRSKRLVKLHELIENIEETNTKLKKITDHRAVLTKGKDENDFMSFKVNEEINFLYRDNNFDDDVLQNKSMHWSIWLTIVILSSLLSFISFG